MSLGRGSGDDQGVGLGRGMRDVREGALHLDGPRRGSAGLIAHPAWTCHAIGRRCAWTDQGRCPQVRVTCHVGVGSGKSLGRWGRRLRTTPCASPLPRLCASPAASPCLALCVPHCLALPCLLRPRLRPTPYASPLQGAAARVGRAPARASPLSLSPCAGPLPSLPMLARASTHRPLAIGLSPCATSLVFLSSASRGLSHMPLV